MIEIKQLKKSYRERLIFQDVNLAIQEGQCVGMYGPSGIGKSTLAKVLCGVLRPDGGEIRMDGALLCSHQSPYDRKLGLSIQMVYQQPYSSLDFRQKIGAGFRELIRYHRFAKSKADAGRLTLSLLEEVGLEPDILQRLPHQISGGEAQRVALARCLLFQPKLLILDEATSMLDVSTQANVIALARRTARKNSGSLLLISHDRDLVNYLCHPIYEFDDTNHIKEKAAL